MSKMIEVFLGEGRELRRSEVISIINGACGQLTYEESNEDDKVQKGFCLTFEFETTEKAEKAIKIVAEKGFHVEGPCDY